ncbi:MAG: hypothetical protein LC687_05760 [Actinobacteria bacterium]|nr:hypothetical protein [Actinomycetota bacterium]
MTKEYSVYHVYGTASKHNPGPKVRKENYPSQYEDAELTNGVLSITITSYGDAPELAYVEVVAVDEHQGKRAFNRTVYDWQTRAKHAAWGV